MYQYIPNKQIWALRPEDIITVYISSNKVQVSRYSGGVAEGSAYICGYKNVRDSFSMFVMIFYPSVKSCDFYFWDNEDIELDTYSEAEEEAVAFCENMGFIMNNTHFRMCSTDEKKFILQECPFAYNNLNEFTAFFQRRAVISREIKKPVSEVSDGDKRVFQQTKNSPKPLSAEISSDAFTRKLARLLSAF